MKFILPDQYTVEKQFISRIDIFLSKHEIGKTLQRSNFKKENGFSCLELFNLFSVRLYR
jgi:hypothetical protein